MIRSAVILAGGLGTRLSEETHIIPKPMVRIGNMPILWHIMKIYYHQGIKNFVICGGYKKEEISFFFRDYQYYLDDFKFDSLAATCVKSRVEDWAVTVLDTGAGAQTAHRLLVASNFLKEDFFHFTYGDGLSNCNLTEVEEFHSRSQSLVTLTAVSPPARFGVLVCENNTVVRFDEKAQGSSGLVNGGFGIVNRDAFVGVRSEAESFENDILPQLAESGDVMAREHLGFWHPMDTLRDKRYLESLWDTGNAPWKIW